MTTALAALDGTTSIHDAELLLALDSIVRRSRFYVTLPGMQTTAVTQPENERSDHTAITINLAGLQNDPEVVTQIKRNEPLVALLRSWMLNAPENDDADLEEQMRELDASRHAIHSLFQWHNH